MKKIISLLVLALSAIMLVACSSGNVSISSEVQLDGTWYEVDYNEDTKKIEKIKNNSSHEWVFDGNVVTAEGHNVTLDKKSKLIYNDRAKIRYSIQGEIMELRLNDGDDKKYLVKKDSKTYKELVGKKETLDEQLEKQKEKTKSAYEESYKLVLQDFLKKYAGDYIYKGSENTSSGPRKYTNTYVIKNNNFKFQGYDEKDGKLLLEYESTFDIPDMKTMFIALSNTGDSEELLNQYKAYEEIFKKVRTLKDYLKISGENRFYTSVCYDDKPLYFEFTEGKLFVNYVLTAGLSDNYRIEADYAKFELTKK